MTALCDALLECPALVEVDLSDNAFGGRSAEPMVPLLSQHPHLQVLKLSNNGLGPAGGSVIARAVLASAQAARAAGRAPNLQRIVCGRNRLEDGSADAWSAALAAHGDSLLEFRAYQNGIRMGGVAALARGLRACRNLQYLDLQDNTAAERGSRALASSLAAWPQLVELNLSDCLLRPRGALVLAAALAKGGNARLARLRLQSDEVDARAVNELAAAVEGGQLAALELIELNGNRCEAEDPAVERLVAALAKHGHDDALDEIDDVCVGRGVTYRADRSAARRSTQTRRKKRRSSSRKRTRRSRPRSGSASSSRAEAGRART